MVLTYRDLKTVMLGTSHGVHAHTLTSSTPLFPERCDQFPGTHVTRAVGASDQIEKTPILGWIRVVLLRSEAHHTAFRRVLDGSAENLSIDVPPGVALSRTVCACAALHTGIGARAGPLAIAGAAPPE